MKTICLQFALLLLSVCGYAQSTNSASYDDLMARSRKARVTAIVMVSTGPILAVGGIGTLIYGIIQNENGDYRYYYDINGNYVQGSRRKYTTEIVVGAAATAIGLGVALGSIAFTNKANELKSEARKIKLKTSTDHFNIPGLQVNYGNKRITQYKLSLVIPLGS